MGLEISKRTYRIIEAKEKWTLKQTCGFKQWYGITN